MGLDTILGCLGDAGIPGCDQRLEGARASSVRGSRIAVSKRARAFPLTLRIMDSLSILASSSEAR
jgi:hypothetical protein